VLCELHGVELTDAHEASADAIAAGRVGLKMAAKYGTDLPSEAAVLHASQITWQEAQNKSFASWMQKNVDPDFQFVSGWPIKRY
jgi:DNA polymerase-3 subunit epsilon